MKCKICGNEKISVVYNGRIRDGKLEHYTDSDVEIYKCDHCKAMWHEPIMNLEQYMKRKFCLAHSIYGSFQRKVLEQWQRKQAFLI